MSHNSSKIPYRTFYFERHVLVDEWHDVISRIVLVPVRSPGLTLIVEGQSFGLQ